MTTDPNATSAATSSTETPAKVESTTTSTVSASEATKPVEALLDGGAAPKAEGTTSQAGGQETPTKTETEAGPERGPDGRFVKRETPQVPEKYEFTLPEGMQRDEALEARFSERFRELGLGQEAAQVLVSTYAEALQVQAKANSAAWQQTLADWVDQARADEEIGGAQHRERLAVANGVLAKHATPELKEFLKETGLANHPEMVRLMYRVGKALADPEIVRGDGAAVDAKTAALRAMYPTMFPEQRS